MGFSTASLGLIVVTADGEYVNGLLVESIYKSIFL